jgi:oxygen-independent coproporphyrinogen-3 oxidase
MLMCQFELSTSAIEQAYPIDFASYFAPELDRLAQLQADGLLTLEPGWINVTPRGRLLIRNVCMVFDRYLGTGSPGPRHSRTI